MKAKDGEFEILLGRMLDGSLDADQHEALSELLRADENLRRKYLDFCQMHAMLQHEQGLLAAWQESLEPSAAMGNQDPLANKAHESTSRTPAGIGGRSRQALLASVVAAFAIAVGLAVLAWLPTRERHAASPERGPAVARLVRTVGARFTHGVDGRRSPPAGSAIAAGRYELQTGFVQLGFETGAQVIVESPAQFEIAGAQKLVLLNGRLSAHVPPSAVGFTIETPSADVVDYGTDFGLEVQSERHAEVHVFDGEVRVRPRSPVGIESLPLQLTTGEASRIDERTGVPAGIEIAAPEFVRTIEELPSAYSRRILELNPAVYYRMEPAADGVTLRDASGNAAHGRVEIGYSPNGVWAAGRIGAALRLGGPALQRYAVVPAYPQAQGDRLSVVAWVYAESRPRWASIAKNWASPNRGQIHFGLRGDRGTLEAHIVDDHGEQVYVGEKTRLPLGEWHHVAFVADGEYLRLYRNGREVDATPYQGLHRNPDATALAIGAKLNASADAPKRTDLSFWDGRLDEIAVFNHALSADQIEELHELGNAP